MLKLFSIGLALLLFLQLPQGGSKSTHSVRLGDVEITLIAARIASGEDIQDYDRLRPRVGYKLALVFLRVKNLALYPSCFSLEDERLRVKQGDEYPRSSNGFKLRDPQTNKLLPTEESFGGFGFEIKDGTEPVALKLVRDVMDDDACVVSQRRNQYTHITGPKSVDLPLQGLPAHTEQSDALQRQLEVEEPQSNAILMDDGFEYRIIDYGVGRIQVREQGARNNFTDQVFWVKFQATNKAEHLIGNPHDLSGFDELRLTDNWGNAYLLRIPQFTNVGRDRFGAEVPIPGATRRRESYKPNESYRTVLLIPIVQFVEQVKGLRIDLAPKSYFKVEEPLSRQRDLLRNQPDPEPSELPVKSVTQTFQAPLAKPKQ